MPTAVTTGATTGERAAEVGGEPRHRRLRGAAGLLQNLLLAALPVSGILFVTNVPSYLGFLLYREQFVALFLGLALIAIFVTIPAGRRAPRTRVPWPDLGAAALGALPCAYVVVSYPELVTRLGELTTARVVLGALLILVALEAMRRTVGWPMVVLVAAFVLYGRYTEVLPGPFRGKATAWPRLVNYLYLDTNSYLEIVGVAATVVLGFIVFGQILANYGGGDFILKLAQALLGRYRGGPAKVSVASSSLFGTISGSAVANVIVDGVVNIPMMKSAGLQPHQAAAVEAVTSTGGQIMPPVMGVAAFLIAEFLEISYAEVVVAAFIPALLYYFALFVQFDLEAARDGRLGLPPASLPRLGRVLREGWPFVLALGFLLWVLLFEALTPALAGLLSGLFTLLVVLATPAGHRRFLPRLGATLVDCGTTLLDITIVLAGAGFVMGVMGISGLGFNLSFTLIQLAQGHVLALLFFSAVVCMILGMGMPTTPAYVLVAVLVAPALVKMGILPLAAHLFIFYFAILSAITPPVALAAFAAAAIAGAEPMRTGWEAMRLALVAYIVPFLFVFSPALIAKGPPLLILLALVTAVAGVWVLGAALTGFLFRPLGWVRRALLATGGLGLMIPVGMGGALGWISDVVGAAIALSLVVWEWRTCRQERPRVAAAV